MAGDVTGQGNGQSQFLAQFLQLIVYQMRGVLILPANVGIHVPDYRQQIRSPVRIVFVDDFLHGEAAEEKDEFDVELAEVGPNKVKVIKVVREVTGLGLKEAKEMVDGAPKVVKEGASKAEAEDIKTKLEAEGAKVNLK